MSAPAMLRWQELACDAALVGLEEAERAELEALDVAAELEALELAAGEIAATTLVGGELVEALPPSLAARLTARLEAPPARPQGEVVPLPARARNAWAPWAIAAAAAVLAVVGWSRGREGGEATVRPVPSAIAPAPVASVSLPEAGRPDERQELLARTETARLPWKATKDRAAEGASGEVVWNADLQRGYMSFRGLAPNEPKTSQYQLWIFDAERDQAYPVDGGVFDVGPSGEVVVPIEAKLHVGKAKLFAVTVEKPGGVVVSKRERIVLTAAPSG